MHSIVLGAWAALSMSAPGAPPATTILQVPGNAGSLGAALEMAPPGALILLDTTELQAPVVITKPVTVVGVPGARVGNEGFCTSILPSPVTLDGPGQGDVVLAGLDLVTATDCAITPALLSGDGFESVRLFDCTLQQSFTGFTGFGFGAPAIETDVSDLYLQDCLVSGAGDGVDICTFSATSLSMVQSRPGILAPSATVTLVRTDVVGGGIFGGVLCCTYCSCSAVDLEAVTPGGDGVVAESVFAYGSGIAATPGVAVLAIELETGPGETCGETPPGTAVVADLLVEDSTVLGSPPTVTLGTAWSVSHGALDDATLLVGLDVSSPHRVPGLGWSLFSNEPPRVMMPLPSATAGSVDFLAPDIPTFAGRIAIHQLWSASSGLHAPTATLFVP